MTHFSVLIYQLIIQAYSLAIRMAAFFNPKAKLWVAGRVNIFSRLASTFQSNKAPVIWMHCASLGEFEQGRPILAYFKNSHTNYKVLLTFFSPSGYEIQKNSPLADYVFYLPQDSPKNAKRFLDIVQPRIVFFVKYDFWYFFLNALQQRSINHYLIAGSFRKEQFFLKGYAKWYLTVIQNFTHLFLQDELSGQILQSKNISNYSIVGDPRIDRVVKAANQPVSIPVIEAFKQNRKLLILGSTHSKDVAIFREVFGIISNKTYFKDWCFLFAPHEINKTNIASIQAIVASETILFSKKDISRITLDTNLFILDTIGQLRSAYQYADAVYIGGGFDKSIHNILEPAVFGLPISIGPKYRHFSEAKELVKRGGVQVISSIDDLIHWMGQLQEMENRLKMGMICKSYIAQNIGSTEKIINYLNKKNIL